MNENHLPKRKPLRLPHYDYSSRGAYFVTICTQDKRPLLSTIVPDTGISADESSVGVGASTTREKGALGASFDGNVKIHLTAIGEIVERHLLSSEKIPGVRIDKYVIMPDHVHVIVFLDPDQYKRGSLGEEASPANRMLPHVISSFKRFCGKEIGEPLFQRGYMERVIRDREDYEAHANYIQKNPARRYFRKSESNT